MELEKGLKGIRFKEGHRFLFSSRMLGKACEPLLVVGLDVDAALVAGALCICSEEGRLPLRQATSLSTTSSHRLLGPWPWLMAMAYSRLRRRNQGALHQKMCSCRGSS